LAHFHYPREESSLDDDFPDGVLAVDPDSQAIWARLNGVWQPGNGGSQVYVRPTGVNDSAGFAAAGQDIGLRAATYNVPTAVTFASATLLEGRGMAAATLNSSTIQDALSSVEVGASGNGFVFTGLGTFVDRFGLKYTITPAAGSGLKFSAANGFRARDVSVRGAYNGIEIATCNGWVANGLLIVDPVNYGLLVSGNDAGDGILSDSFLFAGPTRDGVTAIRWQGGGGTRFHGIKTNRLGTRVWTNAVDLVPASDTSEVSFYDCVFDAYTGKGVNIDGTAAGITNFGFHDVYLRGSLNPTNGYYVRGSVAHNLAQVMIQGGEVEQGTNCVAGFDIDFVDNLTIDGVAVRGVPAASPIVKLGTNVYNATVLLGNIGAPGASTTHVYPAGTEAFLLSIGQQQNNALGGGGGVFEFSWAMPALSSTTVSGSNALNSATINMADVTNLPASGTVYIAGVAVTYTGKTGGVGGSLTGCGAHAAYTGGEYASWYSNLWRLPATMPLDLELSAFITTATGGTARRASFTQRRLVRYPGGPAYTTVGTDTATDTVIDFNWTTSGSDVLIQAKLNATAAYTSVAGWSLLRIVGVPGAVYASS
jgi:hypothetical protein